MCGLASDLDLFKGHENRNACVCEILMLPIINSRFEASHCGIPPRASVACEKQTTAETSPGRHLFR
jgi:hypothetical protein